MTDPFFRSSVSGLDRVTFRCRFARPYATRVQLYGWRVGLDRHYCLGVANTALSGLIFGTPLRWVAMFAPLAFILFMNFRMQTISLGTLKTMFWLYCGSMGCRWVRFFWSLPTPASPALSLAPPQPLA